MKKTFIALAASALWLLSAGVASAAAPIVTSAKITGANVVTVIYTVPVSTSLSSYYNFGGALSGRNLVALSGNGTATVTLTFDGAALPANATGSLYISPATTALSDGSPFSGQSVVVGDGQAPSISSFFVSSSGSVPFGQAGSSVTLTFNANEPVTGPSATIAGHALMVTGTGPYYASYTLTSADLSGGSVPFTVTFTDAAGNTGKVTMTLQAGSAAPVISSVTSNAILSGTLRIGDSIVFTVTPSTPLPNATVTGYYNGQQLSWTTSNGGATYVGIYTVKAGDPSQPIPLQISGVTIRDASGNMSAAVSGSDVAKTITTSAPTVSETSPVYTPTSSHTPTYGFSSTDAGTIVYGGDCSSPTSNAVVGINTIVFNYLPNGLHMNCTISVVNAAGNRSNVINVFPFTVNDGSSSASSTTGSSGASGSSSQSSSSGTSAASSSSSSSASSSGDGYKFVTPLDIGSKGAAVTEVQKRLTELGYYTGPWTGYYGPLTQAAVKKYQKAHGLEQLGNVGPGTRAALNAGQ